jgi:hypothetical protein
MVQVLTLVIIQIHYSPFLMLLWFPCCESLRISIFVHLFVPAILCTRLISVDMLSLSVLMSYIISVCKQWAPCYFCTFDICLLFLAHKPWVASLLPTITLLYLLLPCYLRLPALCHICASSRYYLSAVHHSSYDRTIVFPIPPTSLKLNMSCPPAIWLYTRFLQQILSCYCSPVLSMLVGLGSNWCSLHLVCLIIFIPPVPLSLPNVSLVPC